MKSGKGNFKIHDLNSLFEEAYSEKNELPKDGVENILFRSATEIRFETYLPTRTMIWGPAKHVLGKIVQTGESEFIAYLYEIEGRNLSPEERNYWFQMFDYLRIDF
jgi:hypothetical protein